MQKTFYTTYLLKTVYFITILILNDFKNIIFVVLLFNMYCQIKSKINTSLQVHEKCVVYFMQKEKKKLMCTQTFIFYVLQLHELSAC